MATSRRKSPFIRFYDRVTKRKLTPLACFLWGGAAIGSMSNIYPLYIAPAGFLLAGLLSCLHLGFG